MRASCSWLRQLLPGLVATPTEIAERLTAAGLEVEGTHAFGAGLEQVVVARVQAVAPHPKRDKLQLVTVRHGEGEQVVVCGASNVPPPGGLVALARIGTHLPAIGVTLDARDIGGVPSEGMLCSESELGLAEDSHGILILPPGVAEPGTPLPVALPACQDTIIELSITPNRADALSHLGLARELAALFALQPAELPAVAELRQAEQRAEEQVRVDNREPERCPDYGARVVLDVSLGPSPDWLRWRLFSLGVRPISNVVDVTNLILLELGQPMHAFDLDLVRGGRIEVRRARAAEPMRTLDGVDRELSDDDLVICDGEGPVALAGVMGGENTEIRASTRRVLLEAAHFTARGVRRTSRRHGLSSESSYRFERGVDWAQVPAALDRAAAWLTQLAGGAAAPGAVHAAGVAPVLPLVPLRGARLDALLGVHVPFEDALAVLQRLGLSIEQRTEDAAQVRAASFRPDIRLEADLVEEVARVRGLDQIPALLPAIAPQPRRSAGLLERRARQAALECGLSEAVSYAFVSPEELKAVQAPEAVVRLQNPLSEERAVMRTSLLPGLLEALRRARRRGELGARLFTVGAVFLPSGSVPRSPAWDLARPRSAEDGALPDELPMLAAVLAGAREEYLSAHPAALDVYDASGLAVELVERLTAQRARLTSGRGEPGCAHLHPRGAGQVWVGDTLVGRLGPLHPDVVDATDLGGNALVVELSLGALEAVGQATPRYRPIPRLPAVSRDIALVLDRGVPAGDVQALIAESAGELCESVALFDLFTGGNIPEGQRSLAFRVVYRDPLATSDPERARTLTDKEVDQQHQRVVAAARERFGAQLRE